MDSSPFCPVCKETALVAVPDDPETLSCGTCHGSLIAAACVPEDFRAAVVSTADTAPGEDTAPVPNCPICRIAMSAVLIDESAFLCGECGRAWIGTPADSAENGAEEGPEKTAARISRYLMYSLTLPERVARSAVGVTAGAARETADFLIPQAFKTSKTYEVVIRNSLKFLTEDVGGVAGKPDDVVLGRDFAARKAVGNFVDLAGWATLAVSPVWLMAIISDVAYGSKAYVHELAAELRKKGLIDETSTIHSIDDILGAVKDASGHTASLVDTPPLSVEQLKETLAETRKAVGRADVRRLLPESEIRRYWQEMREIAARENVSLIGVSGALTMHTLNKAGRTVQGAFTGALVVGGLVNKHIIGHYMNAMKDVKERGFYTTIRETSGPYIDAVWNNFAVDRPTWTAELASGRAIGKAFTAVKSWFSRNKPPEAEPGPSTETNPPTA